MFFATERLDAKLGRYNAGWSDLHCIKNPCWYYYNALVNYIFICNAYLYIYILIHINGID